MKPTPGPWEPWTDEYCYETDIVSVAGGERSAAIATMQCLLPEQRANVRLICAAPDLLHACRVARYVLSSHSIVLQDLESALEKVDPSYVDKRPALRSVK